MRYSSPPLSAWPLPMVRFVCDECGRRGQYRKETLIARHGPDIVGPDLLVAVANCPRHKALGELRCGVVYEDLRPSLGVLGCLSTAPLGLTPFAGGGRFLSFVLRRSI
jgi:hypothetical protein